LLVDRPIDGEYFFATERGGSLQAIALPSSHFLGGYEDYLDSASILSEETQSSEYYNRNSTLDDMVFYWTTQHLQSFKVSNPSLNAISHYPLRIVAAEWIKYIAIMYRALKQYEYSTSVTNPRDELEKLNSDMRALQRWRRRSMSSGYKITAVIRMLKANSTFLCSDGDSASLIEDFEYVFAMVEDFGRRLESMLPVVTSLVQIVDSRRSFDETANVSRLTVMALVFVPLAYVSSLFSMNEKLAPGGPRFWVYFVVAIPVTIAVILVAKPPFGMIRRTIRRVRWIRKRKAPDEDRNELNADLSKTEV
jgi:Mg2+ and Co2+ transporter CorA